MAGSIKAQHQSIRKYLVGAADKMPEADFHFKPQGTAPEVRTFGQIVAHLKGRATQQLRAEGIHPFEHYPRDNGSLPTMWAGRYWKVFIDNDEHYEKAIEYVEKNPKKEGKKRQQGNFVREARDAHTDVRRKRRS